MAREPGPEALPSTLEQRRIAAQSDPTEPVGEDAAVDLDFVREDSRLAGTLDAAAAGELTPDEAIDEVAAGLGLDPPDDDVGDDDYEV